MHSSSFLGILFEVYICQPCQVCSFLCLSWSWLSSILVKSWSLFVSAADMKTQGSYIQYFWFESDTKNATLAMLVGIFGIKKFYSCLEPSVRSGGNSRKTGVVYDGVTRLRRSQRRRLAENTYNRGKGSIFDCSFMPLSSNPRHKKSVIS